MKIVKTECPFATNNGVPRCRLKKVDPHLFAKCSFNKVNPRNNEEIVTAIENCPGLTNPNTATKINIEKINKFIKEVIKKKNK